jgi:hypothetical protein
MSSSSGSTQKCKDGQRDNHDSFWAFWHLLKPGVWLKALWMFSLPCPCMAELMVMGHAVGQIFLVANAGTCWHLACTVGCTLGTSVHASLSSWECCGLINTCLTLAMIPALVGAWHAAGGTVRSSWAKDHAWLSWWDCVCQTSNTTYLHHSSTRWCLACSGRHSGCFLSPE